MTDLDTMLALMRYNDFRNDPLSQCSLYNHTCSPEPYNSDLTIASRNERPVRGIPASRMGVV